MFTRKRMELTHAMYFCFKEKNFDHAKWNISLLQIKKRQTHAIFKFILFMIDYTIACIEWNKQRVIAPLEKKDHNQDMDNK